MASMLSKLLSSIRHSGGGSRITQFFNVPTGTGEFDYHKRIGTGQRVSVLMAPIQFIQRSMPEAPLVVERRVRGGDWEIEDNHEAARLLATPNPFYSGIDLWAATVFSYCTDGNAYWAIIRNAQSRPVRLWWLPHWLVSPSFPSDGSEFITGYEYRPGGEVVTLEAEDVIHFRHGINPENPRKGISPVDPAIRDMWVDEESGEFVAALLRNGGVPGLVISPDTDEPPSPEDLEEFKRYMRENFGGHNRGSTLVASGKTKVDRVGSNPSEMNLTGVTDRAEERISALLGIPAAVVGFSAGLEQTKVGATMGEMRKLAWANGIIPMQRTFIQELNRSLVPLFRRQGTQPIRLQFDRSEVAALQEDRNQVVQRVDQAVRGGWMTVASAKRAIGIEPEPGDDVYLRGLSVIAVPSGRRPQRAAPTGERSIRVDLADHKFTRAEVQGILDGLNGDVRKHQHEPFEERIAAERARAEANQAQLAFMEAQDTAGPRLESTLRGELIEQVFDELGKRAAREAQPVLDDELKQVAQDEKITDRVLSAMAMEEITGIFREVHERHYLRVAETTAANMEVFGLATDLPDPVQRAVIATGGRRAGLVDLTAQTRRAMFRALETGRAEGEGIDQLVRRIRDDVPKGPWASSETRARVIARTETKHAQRISVIENARAQDIQQFRIFDARLGPTDSACEDLDGRVVNAQEAEQLMSIEHPNGTRDCVPHFE